MMADGRLGVCEMMENNSVDIDGTHTATRTAHQLISKWTVITLSLMPENAHCTVAIGCQFCSHLYYLGREHLKRLRCVNVLWLHMASQCKKESKNRILPVRWCSNHQCYWYTSVRQYGMYKKTIQNLIFDIIARCPFNACALSRV